MDQRSRQLQDPALLNAAYTACVVTQSYRKGASPDFLEGPIEYLEFALKLAFPDADPIASAAPAEATDR